MLQANELRIGNYLFDTFTIRPSICKLTLDDFQVMNNFTKSNHKIPYKPIPLTQEILLKCGFTRVVNYYYLEIDS